MRFGRWRLLTLLTGSAAAAWSTGACSFPDFFVAPAGGGTPGAAAVAAGGAGAAGATGGVGTGDTSGTGGTGLGATGVAGTLEPGGSNTGATAQGGGGASPAAAAGSAGEGGEGGAGGAPEPVEVGPCGPRLHPMHCLNHQLDPGETDVDCGGLSCAPCASDENCRVDTDCATSVCASGKCARQLSLKYVQQNADAQTPTLHFNSVLAYSGKNPIFLRDLSLRYYFSRNGVTEPILASGSAFQSPSVGEISTDTRFNVVRQLRGNGLTNDAYLEASFVGGRILASGDSLDLTVNASSADGVSLFSQKTHYSYDAGTTLHESKKLAAYYKGQRLWGNGPTIDDPPECFHLGVNLDGAALTVGSDAWLQSPDSGLARYSEQTVTLKPETDAGREQMLRAGFFFHSDTFSYPLTNGKYALVVYVWSANGAETGTLKVQDQTLDTFQATSFAGGGPWVGLGPYRITLASGQLKLASVGDLRVGGIELRLLDE